jgi:hypothetical protein
MSKTMNKNIISGLNEFVREFLTENVTNDKRLNKLLDAWESKQAKLVKVLNASAKKLKDPDAPKKPMSTFLLFSQDERPKIKEETPDIKGAEMTKLISQRWDQLKNSTSKKAKNTLKMYKERAEEKKAEYTQAMADYKAPTPDEIKAKLDSRPKKERKPRVKKAKDAPKGALTAYQIFATDWRQNHDKADFASSDERKEALSTAWKELSEEEKQPWAELHQEDKARFNSEMKKYERGLKKSKANPRAESKVDAEEEESDDSVEEVIEEGSEATQVDALEDE